VNSSGVIMETVKRLIADECQTIKHEIEVHFGRDSAHPSGDPKKELAEYGDHEPKSSSYHEDMIQVDSELQHADLSSVPVKEDSKSVSPSTNGMVTTTPTVKETQTIEDGFIHEEGQVQVQVQERSFQILARGSKAPSVKSGSPGQYH